VIGALADANEERHDALWTLLIETGPGASHPPARRTSEPRPNRPGLSHVVGNQRHGVEDDEGKWSRLIRAHDHAPLRLTQALERHGR
jgi:hypothetical protein